MIQTTSVVDLKFATLKSIKGAGGGANLKSLYHTRFIGLVWLRNLKSASEAVKFNYADLRFATPGARNSGMGSRAAPFKTGAP